MLLVPCASQGCQSARVFQFDQMMLLRVLIGQLPKRNQMATNRRRHDECRKQDERKSEYRDRRLVENANF